MIHVNDMIIFSEDEYWNYLFKHNPNCQLFEGILMVLFDMINLLIDKEIYIQNHDKKLIENSIGCINNLIKPL